MRRYIISGLTVCLIAVMMFVIQPLPSSVAVEGGDNSATSNLLVDRHAAKKIDCQGCHGSETAPKAVPTAQCLKCHGSYEKLAEKEPMHNEAMNPHFGNKKILDCSDCHSVHKKSTRVCKQCHE